MRRINVSLPDATWDRLLRDAERLDVAIADVIRMRLNTSDERGAAGIDDASHATGTVRAARRSPRASA